MRSGIALPHFRVALVATIVVLAATSGEAVLAGAPVPWVPVPGGPDVLFTSAGVPYVLASASSLGAADASAAGAAGSGASTKWLAAPSSNFKVEFTDAGVPFVLSSGAASPVAAPASGPGSAWIAAPGRIGAVQFTESGAPFVAVTGAAPARGIPISPAEMITTDHRIIPAPAVAVDAGATTNGGATPSTVDYGAVPINTTATANVTITYDAGYFIAGATGVTGLNPPFGFSFGTCTSAPGPGTCVVTESFHPTAVGAATGSITIFECPTAGGSCINIPFNIQGTGVGAAFAQPPTLDFGAVPLGTTSSRNVSITVDAGYQVLLAGGTTGLNPPFGFAFNTCGSFTGPGTCSVTESFHPTAVGAASGAIDVFECPTGGGSCIPIHFDITGVGGISKANPTPLNFGSVPLGTTASRDVSITVDAGYQVLLAGGTTGLSPPFGFAFNTCGSFTGPGTCSVTETFHPTALGPASGAIDVFECPTGGGLCIPIHFDIVGVGGASAANPDPLDFGNVPLNALVSRNVEISVDAGYQVLLAGGVTGLNPPFGFAFGSCGSFTGPGNCSVTETFRPTAVGAASGAIDVFECPTGGGLCVPIHFDIAGFGVVVGPPLFQSAVSRRVHGGAGTFDLPLSAVPTTPTTEPRQGPAQNIVFTFDKPANAATASVTEGTATAGAPVFSGNEVIVALTGVGNQQYVTVSLASVGSSDGGSGGNAIVRVGFLVGDVNQSRVVSVADLGLVNAQLSQPVTAANFLKDVNVSGAISVADKGLTNSKLTTALPPP